MIEIYILPTYSPISPNINVIAAPTINNTTIVDDPPSGTAGFFTLLIIIAIVIIVAHITNKNEQTIANLKGFTEKLVNPFIHRCNNFLSV